jgi:hypothetical protein
MTLISGLTSFPALRNVRLPQVDSLYFKEKLERFFFYFAFAH